MQKENLNKCPNYAAEERVCVVHLSGPLMKLWISHERSLLGNESALFSKFNKCWEITHERRIFDLGNSPSSYHHLTGVHRNPIHAYIHSLHIYIPPFFIHQVYRNTIHFTGSASLPQIVGSHRWSENGAVTNYWRFVKRTCRLDSVW